MIFTSPIGHQHDTPSVEDHSGNESEQCIGGRDRLSSQGFQNDGLPSLSSTQWLPAVVIERLLICPPVRFRMVAPDQTLWTTKSGVDSTRPFDL
jgi:hypothetical protein